ncbi:hypothetical protein ACFWFQ_09570, partial [Nocardia salmonicida]|uniref:hypothetical protein n=1 Tax=Nocardia salmonicida TaxID=53431 RepID=UPI003647397A
MTTPHELQTTSGLLERLMQTVDPMFRGEVFFPPTDNRVFVQDMCRIRSCGIALSYASRRLCQGHYLRWTAAGRPDLEQWTPIEELATEQRRIIACCVVRECNRAAKSKGLCHRHANQWSHYGRPDLDEWLARTLYHPPRGSFETDCQFPGCARWCDGPNRSMCRPHWDSWLRAGRMPMAEWLVHLERMRNPRVKLHRLSGQVRLEIGYGLQRRHELGHQHTAPRVVTKAIGWVQTAGVHSLLDWDDDEWRLFSRPREANYDTLSLAFIKDTRFELQALL